VIDLEGLANHRGSAFGDRSSATANNGAIWKQSVFHSSEFNPNQPIWVEDESRLIGQVSIPDAFYTKMRDQSIF
jgi:tRNA 2-selenouridine synthase